MGHPPRHLDVLFITHNYPRHSGDFAGRFLERLASLLIVRGISVGVVVPHDPGAAEFEVMTGVPVWRFRYASDRDELIAYRGQAMSPSLFGSRGIWAYWRFFSSFKTQARAIQRQCSPRVIHAHWWLPAGWIARSIIRDERFIVTSHGTDARLLESKTWLRPMARTVYSSAHLVTTVSRSLARTIEASVPHVRGRVQIAPMPPDDALFTGSVKEDMRTVPIILCVTRYTLQKRNDVFLRALDRLKSAGVLFQARMIGDGGSEREHILRLIDQLGLKGDVQLVPSMPQAELAEEYRRADLAVLPAVNEGFGLTLVEAQMCGTPVVGVRSGGVVDIINDETSGLLAQPDDPEDLARAMRRVLGDQSLRVRLATAGQRSAAAQFSSAAIADRFVAWYQLG